MSSYDTDLWYNYPDVMRRSGSENPQSEFRALHPHRHTQLRKERERSKRKAEAKKKLRGDDDHVLKHSSHEESVKMRDGTFTPPRQEHKVR